MTATQFDIDFKLQLQPLFDAASREKRRLILKARKSCKQEVDKLRSLVEAVRPVIQCLLAHFTSDGGSLCKNAVRALPLGSSTPELSEDSLWSVVCVNDSNQGGACARRLFSAGDCFGKTTAYMPSELRYIQALLDSVRLCIVRYTKTMALDVTRGTPALMSAGACKSWIRCQYCEVAYPRSLHYCVDESRREGCCVPCAWNTKAVKGCCPRVDFDKNKKQHLFCPHQSRCLKCDVCSFEDCQICKILVGGGTDVASLMREASLRICNIFIDFDLTLCTTKGGANPQEGKHELDAELLSVVFSCLMRDKSVQKVGEQGHHITEQEITERISETGALVLERVAKGVKGSKPVTSVLTKNTHARGIREFLDGYSGDSSFRDGLDACCGGLSLLDVRAVRSGRHSKPREICLVAASNDLPCIFVDDDINEHAALREYLETLENPPVVYQVLFSRDI